MLHLPPSSTSIKFLPKQSATGTKGGKWPINRMQLSSAAASGWTIKRPILLMCLLLPRSLDPQKFPILSLNHSYLTEPSRNHRTSMFESSPYYCCIKMYKKIPIPIKEVPLKQFQINRKLLIRTWWVFGSKISKSKK